MAQQDLQCPFCPKVSTRGTGLASHIRGAHPKQYAGWSKARKSGEGKPGQAPVVAAMPSGGSGMGDVVTMLQQQRSAIEAALVALRAVGAPDPGTPATKAPAKRGRKKGKGGMTPEGKARLIAALKKRWAERKAAVASGLPKGKPSSGRPKKS